MRKLAILLALVSVFFSACSKATPEPVTFTVEFSEYKFTPDTFEVKVGQQVTFELVNVGVLDHEIMFGRDVEIEDGHPHGFETDMFEFAGVEPPMVMMVEGEMGSMEMEEDHHGFMVHLEKTGDKATMTFTATKEMEGEWEIGCFELDGVHYEQGMLGTFTVVP